MKYLLFTLGLAPYVVFAQKNMDNATHKMRSVGINILVTPDVDYGVGLNFQKFKDSHHATTYYTRLIRNQNNSLGDHNKIEQIKGDTVVATYNNNQSTQLYIGFQKSYNTVLYKKWWVKAFYELEIGGGSGNTTKMYYEKVGAPSTDNIISLYSDPNKQRFYEIGIGGAPGLGVFYRGKSVGFGFDCLFPISMKIIMTQNSNLIDFQANPFQAAGRLNFNYWF